MHATQLTYVRPNTPSQTDDVNRERMINWICVVYAHNYQGSHYVNTSSAHKCEQFSQIDNQQQKNVHVHIPNK